MKSRGLFWKHEIDGMLGYGNGDVKWAVEYSWLEFRRENETGVVNFEATNL